MIICSKNTPKQQLTKKQSITYIEFITLFQKQDAFSKK